MRDKKDAAVLSLEERICAIESGEEAGSDFIFDGWIWMILLGVVLPVALLLWGWFG